MGNVVAPFLAGILFGAGLTLSQMVNPAKVIGFLDVAGNWDPSLAFVMGGAVAVTTVTFRFILRRPAPILTREFSLPSLKEIDGRLIGGSAVFGIGWGLSGFCPGPAIATLAFGLLPSAVFVSAMIAGMELSRVSLGRPTASPRSDG